MTTSTETVTREVTPEEGGTVITCACDETFTGTVVHETLLISTAEAEGVVGATGDDGQPLQPESLVSVLERVWDDSAAHAAYCAHVSDGDGLDGRLRCSEVARVEAQAREAEAAAAAAVQAAIAAAEQERQDVLRARQVQEALLSLLAPKTGATS